jgi:hypothetical protein
MHITKNYLADQGAMSKSTKVPLVLGIWGPKGCGKTFQVCLGCVRRCARVGAWVCVGAWACVGAWVCLRVRACVRVCVCVWGGGGG